MAYHEFPEYRQIVEEIPQGKRTQRFVSKQVAVGDTVEFFSAPLYYPPHEALSDEPEENSISAVVQVSKVERAAEVATGPAEHGKPWLIHFRLPAGAV